MMKTRFFKILGLGVLIALMSGGPVSALMFGNPTLDAFKEERVEKRTELRRDRADKELERRIAALTRLVDLLNKMKRISESQKVELISQVQAEIASLQTLKAKIDGDTDPATLLADKKSIVSDYRVFALFMPKIRILANADKILTTAGMMKGKNPNASAMEKITDAINQANYAINTVMSLTPSGWPDNKSSLQSASNMLSTARKDLREAWVLMKSATP